MSVWQRDALKVEEGYSLHDVVDGRLDVPPNEGWTLDYHGFIIVHDGRGRYLVHKEGHVGKVMDFHEDDYDDVLELVADLNQLLTRFNDFDYRDDDEGLVEWAGKMVTGDEEKAEERPDLYMNRRDLRGE